MRLAFIGDIHAFTLRVTPRRLLSRRIVAQSNLWLNRRFRFDHALLMPLMDRIFAVEPDLVLCSGDITTSSLHDEFALVRAWFEPLAERVPVLVVPGNHDRYTFRSQRGRRMEQHLAGLMPSRFPHDRPLTDNWRLVALDSGIPQIVMSRGALGVDQADALERLLDPLTDADGLVLLCHYPAASPPGVPKSWAHELAEARRVRRLLDACPARVLYLHGHIHQPWYWPALGRAAWRGGRVRTPRRRRPRLVPEAATAKLAYLNAGSPCMTSNRYPAGQGFWQIDLPDEAGGEMSLLHHVPLPPPGQRRRLKARHAQPAEPLWETRAVP